MTYNEMLKEAKRRGYELTPTLRSELLMLSLVPDDEIMRAARKATAKIIAEKFQVPIALAIKRTGADLGKET